MSRHREDGSGYRSPLAAYASQLRETDPALGRSAAARMWHELGLFVANPEHVNGWATQQQIINLGNELYGKRRDDR